MLQDSEKRYRRLFESAKDGILIFDADKGKVVDVNPFLLQLLGYSYDSLYKQHIWELGVFKDITASKAAIRPTDITRQLLAFARKQTILPVVLYLNQTVESLLKMLRRLIGEIKLVERRRY